MHLKASKNGSPCSIHRRMIRVYESVEVGPVGGRNVRVRDVFLQFALASLRRRFKIAVPNAFYNHYRIINDDNQRQSHSLVFASFVCIVESASRPRHNVHRYRLARMHNTSFKAGVRCLLITPQTLSSFLQMLRKFTTIRASGHFLPCIRSWGKHPSLIPRNSPSSLRKYADARDTSNNFACQP